MIKQQFLHKNGCNSNTYNLNQSSLFIKSKHTHMNINNPISTHIYTKIHHQHSKIKITTQLNRRGFTKTSHVSKAINHKENG